MNPDERLARIEQWQQSHEQHDSERFADIKQDLVEVKQDVKALRKENTQQHKEARDEYCGRFDKIEEKIDRIHTRISNVKDVQTKSFWTKRTLVISGVVLLVVGAVLGMDGVQEVLTAIPNVLKSVLAFIF